MFKRQGLALAGMLIAVLVVSPACVSKKLFKKNNEQTDSRVTGVETAVEENERRISDLRSETDSKIAAVDGTAIARTRLERSLRQRTDVRTGCMRLLLRMAWRRGTVDGSLTRVSPGTEPLAIRIDFRETRRSPGVESGN